VGNRLFSSPKRTDRLLGPPSLLINGYRGSFLEIRQSGPDVNCSLSSNVEVKNEWSYIYSPYMRSWRGLREQYLSYCQNSVELKHEIVIRKGGWARDDDSVA
jgi:hypothetical protein